MQSAGILEHMICARVNNECRQMLMLLDKILQHAEPTMIVGISGTDANAETAAREAPYDTQSMFAGRRRSLIHADRL